MTTRIILEVPDRLDDDLAGISNNDLALLLRDALYEFKAHRANGNGEVYVDKRYPGDSVYNGEARVQKAAQVTKRCQWAQALHACAVRVIEHVSFEE